MALLRMLVFKPQGLIDVPKTALPNSRAGTDQVVQSPEQKQGENHDVQAVITQKEITHEKKPLADELASTNSGEQALNINAALGSKKLPVAEAIDSLAGEKDPEQYDSEPVSASKVGISNPSQNKLEEIKKELAQFNAASVKSKQTAVQVPPAHLVSSSSPAISNTSPSPAVVDNEKKNETQETKATAARKEDNKGSRKKISLEQFSPEDWIEVYHDINFRGIVQSTAANCIVIGCEGNFLQFVIDEHKTSLYDQSHALRMADLLGDYFGHPVKVDIQLSTIPEIMETPAQHGERVRLEKHRARFKGFA